MIERMGDTVGLLWAAVLAGVAACIRMFYVHGGRLSAVESTTNARLKALEEAHQDNKRWLIKIHKSVTDIQVRLGGTNGKRRKQRGYLVG